MKWSQSEGIFCLMRENCSYKQMQPSFRDNQ